MTPNEQEELIRIANLIQQGKDEWIGLDVEGQAVRTTTLFVKKYKENLVEWVKEFSQILPKIILPKIHQCSDQIAVSPEDRWEKTVDNELIYQIYINDPNDKPTILIETYHRLVEKKILLPFAQDGNHRYAKQ